MEPVRNNQPTNQLTFIRVGDVIIGVGRATDGPVNCLVDAIDDMASHLFILLLLFLRPAASDLNAGPCVSGA